MTGRKFIGIVVALVLVAGCSATGPTTPPPSAGSPLTLAELRYSLVDDLGPLWYCDRDLYPVAVADEAKVAIQRFAEIQADAESFDAIVDHLGIAGAGDFTDEQKPPSIAPGSNSRRSSSIRSTVAPTGSTT